MDYTSGRLALPLHTLETLCQSLISGYAVARKAPAADFQLETPASRSLLNWYWKNRPRWSGVPRLLVRAEDCEALAEAVDLEPPSTAIPELAGAQHRRRLLHLRSVSAHRFGGLHRYGSLTQAPPDFRFTLERPLTVVEAKNGAGKTSFLSAIAWCLSGLAYRSQRPPEPTGDMVIPIAPAEEAGLQESEHSICGVAPVPPVDVLRNLGTTRVPMDTWVEVVLEDEEGEEFRLRRGLRRTSRGSIEEEKPDLAQVGIDPIAWSLGTVLTAQIPYVAFSGPSDLGSAVASLTGLRPLKDLSKHAARAKEKLSKELLKERRQEIEALEKEFQQEREPLARLVAELSHLDAELKVPSGSYQIGATDEIARLLERLATLQERLLADSRSVLGDGFDPADAAARQELKRSLETAVVRTQPDALKELPSLTQLEDLLQVSEDDLRRADALLEAIESEAQELSDLERSPEVAHRRRLYERVAGWLRTKPEQFAEVLVCPLCLRPFTDESDPLLNEGVSALLATHLAHSRPFLEKTLGAWTADAKRRLVADLAPVLRQSLPEAPAGLLIRGVGDELFERTEFRGALHALKSLVSDRWAVASKELSSFEEPPPVSLSGAFGADGQVVSAELTLVRRAVAGARWLKACHPAMLSAYRHVVGAAASTEEFPDLTEGSLCSHLATLERLLQSTRPLEEAERLASRLKSYLARRTSIDARIGRYGRAALAIEPLVHLDHLVEEQLGELIQALSERTTFWRRCLYKSAIVDGPEFHKGDVGSDGRLELTSVVGGTQVSSQHVANSSDLRATLFAFLFAFIEHVLRERGGLSLLLLDDPQELFDPNNRRSVADTLPRLLNIGLDVLVTTNDRAFHEQVYQSARAAIAATRLDRLRLHPCHRYIAHARFTRIEVEATTLKQAFENSANFEQDQVARQYAKEVREFAEARLIDCLETAGVALAEFELDGLLRQIKRLGREQHKPFSHTSFTTLVKEFPPASGNSTLVLISRAHHGHSPEVTFAEVWGARVQLARLLSLVEEARFEWELWLRRELPPSKEEAELPPLPEPVLFPKVSLPILTDLAAFSTGQPVSVMEEVIKYFDPTWFDGKALYLLNTDNLGFAARAGQTVIVSLDDLEEVEDRRLVIALYRDKVFARRLLRFGGRSDVVCLASEAENPLERKASLIIPAGEVRLLKVVGVLFDQTPVGSGREEATQVLSSPSLRHLEVMFGVEGESALPLALDGQWIIGGPPISAEGLAREEGSLIALAAGDEPYLKRVGQGIGRDYRLFESIGLRGSSLVLSVGGSGSGVLGVETVTSARRVLGVLYGSEFRRKGDSSRE